MNTLIHTWTHTCAHMYSFMHTDTHAHRHTCSQTHMQTCTHTHAYIYTHACSHAHIHLCTHTHMCTHTNTHRHTHTHTDTHTVWQLLHFQFSMRDRGRQKARSESLVLQLPWALPPRSLHHRRPEASLGSCLSSLPCFSGPRPITAHRRCSKARLSLCPFSIHEPASLRQVSRPLTCSSFLWHCSSHSKEICLRLLFPLQGNICTFNFAGNLKLHFKKKKSLTVKPSV